MKILVVLLLFNNKKHRNIWSSLANCLLNPYALNNDKLIQLVVDVFLRPRKPHWIHFVTVCQRKCGNLEFN